MPTMPPRTLACALASALLATSAQANEAALLRERAALLRTEPWPLEVDALRAALAVMGRHDPEREKTWQRLATRMDEAAGEAKTSRETRPVHRLLASAALAVRARLVGEAGSRADRRAALMARLAAELWREEDRQAARPLLETLAEEASARRTCARGQSGRTPGRRCGRAGRRAHARAPGRPRG